MRASSGGVKRSVKTDDNSKIFQSRHKSRTENKQKKYTVKDLDNYLTSENNVDNNKKSKSKFRAILDFILKIFGKNNKEAEVQNQSQNQQQVQNQSQNQQQVQNQSQNQQQVQNQSQNQQQVQNQSQNQQQVQNQSQNNSGNNSGLNLYNQTDYYGGSSNFGAGGTNPITNSNNQNSNSGINGGLSGQSSLSNDNNLSDWASIISNQSYNSNIQPFISGGNSFYQQNYNSPDNIIEVQTIEHEEFDGDVGVHDAKSKDERYNAFQKADGIIDDSFQGQTGDCWLLSGLKSLSMTSWGREEIKNAININEETGDVSVTLKGAEGGPRTYNISASELKSAQLNSKYSRGDLDVNAFELAIEKYRGSIDGGQEYEVYKLVTGSCFHTEGTPREMSYILEDAKQNPDKYALSANFDRIQGEGAHAYNISGFEKGEDGQDYVVLTNPWNSGEDIRMTEKEFYNTAYEIQALGNTTGFSYDTEIVSDGKIGNTTGSLKRNDTKVTDAIYQVANENPNFFNECLQKDDSGNINVTLKGVDTTYSITPRELAHARSSGNYTQGDDDVIALELAMERYNKIHYAKQSGINTHPIESSVSEVKKGKTIDNISTKHAKYLLTGKKK